MGNYIETKKEIENYIFARIPLIILDTKERERAERLLAEAGREMKIEIACYTDMRQVYHLGSNVTRDVDSDPLPFVADQFRRKRGVTFVLGDVRKISEDSLFAREIVNLLYLAIEQACTLIIITPDMVWQRVAAFGLKISLDLPDAGEREAQIKRFRARFGGRFPIEWGEEEISRASALLRGFTELQIENIMSSVMVEHGGLGREQLYELTRLKSRMYAAVPCIQEVRVREDLEVSGLDRLKDWLREKKKLFFVPDEVLRKYDLTPPKGILLAGVPGCGKSYSAKMTAREWELPLFRFDIGSVYDKWVGESERRMREALKFIDNVAPCVVWIDEIEKALSISEAGNDTGKRVLGQFLFWLQESESRVFLVATANDIGKLPPELFRKGRFSEMFFVDLPKEKERRQAICQYGMRSLRCHFGTEFLEELVQMTEGFSFADIEYVIKEAAQKVLLYGTGGVGEEQIRELFQRVIPFERTNPEAVEALRRWGAKRAVSASIEENEGGEGHE